MRSSETRDKMTARVAEAYKKWPTFDAMPQTKDPGRKVRVAGVGKDGVVENKEDYIKALFACCYDSTPIGRDGHAIVGVPAKDNADNLQSPAGRRLMTGDRK